MGSWLASRVCFLKQHGKIHQSYVQPVLLNCGETWKLSIADDLRLRGVEQHMITITCGIKLVDRVSSDALRKGWMLLSRLKTFQ